MVRRVLRCGLGAFCLALAVPVTVPAQTLPADVQADLMRVRIDTALKSGDTLGALRMLDEMAALAVDLPPGDLALIEARVAMAAADFARAEAALTGYLATADRTQANYPVALEMLASLADVRAMRLGVMRTDARIAESNGDYARAEMLLTSILTQVDRNDPLYAEVLDLLSGLPARRDQAAALLAEKQAKAEEARLTRARRDAAIEGERQVYLSDGFDPSVVLRLRWILNARYGQSLFEPPPHADYLTDAERDHLVLFRRDNGLDDGQDAAVLRYLDGRTYAAARDMRFEPLRPDFSMADQAERSGDWWSTTTGVRGGADFTCDALSVAVAMGPGQEYLFPTLSFVVAPGQSNGAITLRSPRFDPSIPIEVSIDGRPMPAGSTLGGLDLDGQTRLTRGMRAGSELTVTGVSPISLQRVTYTYSLKGFTSAFERMTRLCQRSDALGWIR